MFFKIKKKFAVHLSSILRKKKLKFVKVKSIFQGHTASCIITVELELRSPYWSPCCVQADVTQHAYASIGAAIYTETVCLLVILLLNQSYKQCYNQLSLGVREAS